MCIVLDVAKPKSEVKTKLVSFRVDEVLLNEFEEARKTFEYSPTFTQAMVQLMRDKLAAHRRAKPRKK